ncbi:hypothetical protein DES42_11159 [Zavarzinia compransoris]|nr:hypothetical protein DES42_11159 [Zavarzinia compransoris]
MLSAMDACLRFLGPTFRRLLALVLVCALGAAVADIAPPAQAAPEHCAGDAAAKPERPDCCLGALCLMHCALPLPPGAAVAEVRPAAFLAFEVPAADPAAGLLPPPPLPPPRVRA